MSFTFTNSSAVESTVYSTSSSEFTTVITVPDLDFSIDLILPSISFVYYSQKKINLILPEDRDYYGILRDKLKWGDNLC